MAQASPSDTIVALRHQLERLECHGRPNGGALPFGLSTVDQHLPDGGLRLGHLHEILEGGPASEYAGLATLFAAGIAARLRGPVLWCSRGRDLFAPALSRVGLHPDRVIYCETWNDREVLPAIEEGLRCKGLAAVVGELTKLSLTNSRRLQLCAGETGVTALLLRRWRNTTERALAEQPTAAATRWRISPSPSSSSLGFEGLPSQLWQVDLLRVRSGEPHSWILEACDAAGHLSLSAALAERPAAADTQRRMHAG